MGRYFLVEASESLLKSNELLFVANHWILDRMTQDYCNAKNALVSPTQKFPGSMSTLKMALEWVSFSRQELSQKGRMHHWPLLVDHPSRENRHQI